VPSARGSAARSLCGQLRNLLVGGAVVLMVAGAVVAANFVGGEKKIERRIERLYALDDPRFTQELGRAARAASHRRQSAARASQR